MSGRLSKLGQGVGWGAQPPPGCIVPTTPVSLSHPNPEENFPNLFYIVSQNHLWNNQHILLLWLPPRDCLGITSQINMPQTPSIQGLGKVESSVSEGGRMEAFKEELVLSKILLIWTLDPDVNWLSVPARNQRRGCSTSLRRGREGCFIMILERDWERGRDDSFSPRLTPRQQ